LRGESCRIFGDGETTRDFCYVANVVQANLLAAAAASSTATGHAYNVACASAVSLNQLFEMMRDRLAAIDARFASATPHYDPFRPGDIRYSGASIEKARRMLDYTPSHDVAAGLTEALDWYIGQSRATRPGSSTTNERSDATPATRPEHGRMSTTVRGS
jgi:UDP-N-acetylglucosamine 4-epimerase